MCQQAFACRVDALVVIEQWQEKQATLVVEGTVIEVQVYNGKGRLGTNQQPVSTYYEISGNLYMPLEMRDEATKRLGLFILATNDIGGSLSMADMLSTYKYQQAVEKGFRFLKSPDFLMSTFDLKRLERIEALLMVMTNYLMVYAVLEHTIREQLKAQDVKFFDMKKKPTQTPAARWVFQCFAGIDLLTISELQMLLLNRKDRQSVLIKILGINYQRIYS
ncbi:MAG: transposase [Paraglaciecola sp.]